MPTQIRYAHTNLVARDLRALSAFYCDVLACVPVMDAEEYSGPWVEAITAVEGAVILVQHLRLPGHGDGGPTLELIQYGEVTEGRGTLLASRPGFGHVAFGVDDVAEAKKAVLEAGGGEVGETVSVDMGDRGHVTEVYVSDPEGNIIELCKWT
ncbi:MAG: VOC family protein [Planctomycetota bacterium]|jgi:catechol 2,3-dioxygenase-like lactoylglutathione lyase family enzyme